MLLGNEPDDNLTNEQHDDLVEKFDLPRNDKRDEMANKGSSAFGDIAKQVIQKKMTSSGIF